MTDRISSTPGSRPLPPAPKPKAAAGAEVGAMARDGLGLGAGKAALGAAAARAGEGVAKPPSGGSAIGRFFEGVGDWLSDFGVGVYDVAADAWDGVTDLFREHAPLGAYEKLVLETRTQFPKAIAKAWRGQPAPGEVADAVPPAEAKAMSDLARRALAGERVAITGSMPRAAKAIEAAGQVRAALGPDADRLLADQAVRAAVEQRVLAIATRFGAPAGQAPPVTEAMAEAAAEAGAKAAKTWQIARSEVEGASQQELVARAAAVAKLAPATRARFDALRARFAGSPRPQEALDALLASGKLLKADLVEGKTTLDHLEAIASGPLAPGIAGRRDDFLGETLMELAEPASVCQRGRNTCGAASAQGWLAEVEPGEYARLAYGLATPEGKVKTAKGDALERDPHWAVEENPGEGDLRTTSSRLLQASLMDLASNGDYDNAVDRGRWAPVVDWIARNVPVTEGAWPHGVSRLMESISGRDYDWIMGDNKPEARGVFERATRSNPIPVLLNYTTEGEGQALHWVRLVGHDPATDVFTVRNAQRGTEDRIAGDEFRQRMIAVACRPEDMPGAR